MKIIGITGGMAGGKSTVTRMFADLGARTFSADTDAREVLKDGSSTLGEIIAAFPDTALPGGSLDRAALAARIFADPAARQRLESITHPAIIARMRSVIDEARAEDEDGVLLYEVPLLYEAGLARLFDAVIAVVTTRDVQEARLQQRERRAGRPPLSADALAARLGAQMSVEEKARLADYVVRTDGSLGDTRAQVEEICRDLLS